MGSGGGGGGGAGGSARAADAPARLPPYAPARIDVAAHMGALRAAVGGEEALKNARLECAPKAFDDADNDDDDDGGKGTPAAPAAADADK